MSLQLAKNSSTGHKNSTHSAWLPLTSRVGHPIQSCAPRERKKKPSSPVGNELTFTCSFGFVFGGSREVVLPNPNYPPISVYRLCHSARPTIKKSCSVADPPKTVSSRACTAVLDYLASWIGLGGKYRRVLGHVGFDLLESGFVRGIGVQG